MKRISKRISNFIPYISIASVSNAFFYVFFIISDIKNIAKTRRFEKRIHILFGKRDEEGKIRCVVRSIKIVVSNR